MRRSRAVLLSIINVHSCLRSSYGLYSLSFLMLFWEILYHAFALKRWFPPTPRAPKCAPVRPLHSTHASHPYTPSHTRLPLLSAVWCPLLACLCYAPPERGSCMHS